MPAIEIIAVVRSVKFLFYSTEVIRRTVRRWRTRRGIVPAAFVFTARAIWGKRKLRPKKGKNCKFHPVFFFIFFFLYKFLCSKFRPIEILFFIYSLSITQRTPQGYDYDYPPTMIFNIMGLISYA